MINSTNNIGANIITNGQKLEVTSFEYLGANLCEDGTCLAEAYASTQDCPSNGSTVSNDQTKQDLALKHNFCTHIANA